MQRDFIITTVILNHLEMTMSLQFVSLLFYFLKLALKIFFCRISKVNFKGRSIVLKDGKEPEKTKNLLAHQGINQNKDLIKESLELLTLFTLQINKLNKLVELRRYNQDYSLALNELIVFLTNLELKLNLLIDNVNLSDKIAIIQDTIKLIQAPSESIVVPARPYLQGKSLLKGAYFGHDPNDYQVIKELKEQLINSYKDSSDVGN
jgi:hypothetical protein